MIEITTEMRTNTARNIYNEIIKVKNCIFLAYSNEFVEMEIIFEQMGYVIQSCIHEIMRELNIYDDAMGQNYGTILDCIEDDDTFEFMMGSLGLEV